MRSALVLGRVLRPGMVMDSWALQYVITGIIHVSAPKFLLTFLSTVAGLIHLVFAHRLTYTRSLIWVSQTEMIDSVWYSTVPA